MLGRFLKKIRSEGLPGVLESVRRRLRALYSEDRAIVYSKDLDQIVPCRRNPAGIVVEDLGRDQLPLLAELNLRRGLPQLDRRFVAFVEAGFPGFVSVLDEKAVGYYWWVDRDRADEFRDFRERRLGIRLGPDEVYGSDFFVLEEYRNGRIANEILANVESALKTRGYARLWGYVDADNRPARWLYASRGYEERWRRVCKRRLFHVSTQITGRTEETED